MAGTIITDKIQTENSFLTLNVGQTQIATMNSSGVFSNTGIKMIGTDGTVTAILSSPTISGNLNLDSTGTTGVRVPSANTLVFYEGGVEAVRIDSSGNVGIGTSSPAQKLDIGGSGNSIMRLVAAGQANGLELGQLTADGGNKVFATNNNYLAFGTNNTERMRIDSGGNVGIGTSSPVAGRGLTLNSSSNYFGLVLQTSGTTRGQIIQESTGNIYVDAGSDGGSGALILRTTAGIERMRIDSSGILYFGTTTANPPPNNVYGVTINASTSSGVYAAGVINASANGSAPLSINRGTDDGTLVNFYQAGTVEGSVSVSGTTVSYNGGHLARWSQLPNNQKDDTLLKGTVMSNLDEMCVWTKDGEVLPNEQLNKMKVSDVDGDINVAGVFVNWDNEDVSSPIDMNVAMTGDMIIRIAEGVTVARGDLLMSAGDGTAKPQSDDIVRSKTIAKVTSTHVTCTYEDGSYCVPCVLMAC